jgi:dihydroneopterin aldolase
MPGVPDTLISIEGIRALGRHGANPGEQQHAQEFLVDLDVWVRTTADSLEGTLDYRTIVESVRRAVETTSFELLETLAKAVATALIDLEAVALVTAVVHKPGAARSLGVGDVSAQVTLGPRE